MRSMALRPRQSQGEKQFFHLRLDFGGMLGTLPAASIWRWMSCKGNGSIEIHSWLLNVILHDQPPDEA